MFDTKKYGVSDMGFIPLKCSEIPQEFRYLIHFMEIKDTETDFHKYVNDYQKKNNQIIVDFDKYEEGELQAIYSISCLLSHYYVWLDKKNPQNVLPYIIAYPWWNSSMKLGIKPVLTHAAVDLWNWELIDDRKQFSLDNIKSKYLMLKDDKNKMTESWFYLIMTAIEGECGRIIYFMDNIYKVLESDKMNKEFIYENLDSIEKILMKQIFIINRIYEKCNPNIFYNELRTFLWGSDKLKDGLTLQEKLIKHLIKKIISQYRFLK